MSSNNNIRDNIDVNNLTYDKINEMSSFFFNKDEIQYNFILVEEIIDNETIRSVYLFKNYNRYSSYSLKKNNLDNLAIFCNDNMKYIPVNFSDYLSNFFFHNSTFKIYDRTHFSILNSSYL